MVNYPSALQLSFWPSRDPAQKANKIELGSGQTATITFKDPVFAFAFTYQQGLSPALFTVHQQNHAPEDFHGAGYFPTVGFFGFCSRAPVTSVEFATVGAGSFYIRGFHFFSRRQHQRVFAR
jgi:hypothetical protein